MTPTVRNEEAGIVLVNVLVILAIASSVVFLMLSSRDAALDRVALQTDAARAEWLALGAEASVVDALRRDLDTGPDADHFNEPWASVIQEEAVLPTGRFSVAVRDAQARFDINLLAAGTLSPAIFLERLLAEVGQPPDAARDISRVLSVTGPVARLEDLEAYGIPPQVLGALEPYADALPVPGTINLNTADPLLLRAMFNNRAAAARVQRLRDSRGEVTRDGLAEADVLRPENSGFTSRIFDVEVLAESGAARVALRSRILRTDDLSGKGVVVIRRSLVPPDSPPPTADAANESGPRIAPGAAVTR